MTTAIENILSNNVRVEKLRLLDSYGINQDQEWVMRDWIQNFIDGARAAGSMKPFDNLKISFGANQMRIEGPTYFDIENLLFIGATTKTGKNDQIGEKGEGLKITTLIAMRDFNCSVTYGAINSSKTWVALGAWENVTINGKEQRELCFNIHQFNTENYQGDKSWLSVVADESTIEEFGKMDYKNWFVHDDNPNFKNNKITENIYALPDHEECGRIFLAGLDRGTDHRLSFIYVVNEKVSGDNDRDRKSLSEMVMRSALMKLIGKGFLPQKIYSKLFDRHLDDLIGIYCYGAEPAAMLQNPNFVDMFIKHYKSELHHFTYSESNTRGDDSLLRRLGVKQVYNYALIQRLKECKVKPIEALIDTMHKAKEVKKTSKMKQQANDLMDMVRHCGIDPLPIIIFDPTDCEEYIMGTYNETFVRLNVSLFGPNSSFGQTMSVYVHELAHEYGSDESATFSDKLTEYMGRTLGHGMNEDRQIGIFMMYANIAKGWNK
jgi:hypothetical protein